MTRPAISHANTTIDFDERRTIKCVVWDLDNTLWWGTLLESSCVLLRPEVPIVLRVLDERGILHSIASRNDPAVALAKLEAFGLRDYFLHPQISWGSKVPAIRSIAERLAIGLDALAFVDDDAAERAEVEFALPQVRCFESSQLAKLPTLSEFEPRIVSPDARTRRQMYLDDIARRAAEESFDGPQEAFLATLEMRVGIAPAAEGDLSRAEELTLRTNQLNSTGYTFNYAELERLRHSDRHILLMAQLEDRFGTYGKVGLAVVECDADVWTVRLLLISCRVISRGVGTLLMGCLLRAAEARHVRLLAEFIQTGRNRLMYITFQYAGFREIERRGEVTILEHDLAQFQPFPEYVTLDAPALALG